MSCAGLTFGKQNGGGGDGFARCAGGKIGLETPELVGIPVFIRGCSSETALAEFPRLAHTHTRTCQREQTGFATSSPLLAGLAQFLRVLLSPLGVRCLSRPFSSIAQPSGPPCVPCEATSVCVGISGVTSCLSGLLEHQSQPVGASVPSVCSCSAL